MENFEKTDSPDGEIKMEKKIPFNKPFVAGKELYYIAQAVTMGEFGR